MVELPPLDASYILSNVWDPEFLTICLYGFKPALGQFRFWQSQKREMWKIAQDGLKPTVDRHNLAHTRIVEFVCVKRQHCDVL